MKNHFFSSKDIIGFGPSDEVFYKELVPELVSLSKNNKNFYAHVISLTSHSPFELPEEKQMITLPSKYNDTLVGNYLLSAYYADYAIGKFIDDLKQNNLWDNSMFVLYGDHSGVHGELLKDKDVELMHGILGHGYSLLDRFNIPFIVTIPGQTDSGQVFSNIGGQIDIMPTITNLFGITLNDQIHFGQDLLNYQKNLLGMRYYLPAGSFLTNDVMLIPQTSQRPKRIYDIETKQKIETNGQYNSYYDDILKLLNWSDSYIRSLPNR